MENKINKILNKRKELLILIFSTIVIVLVTSFFIFQESVPEKYPNIEFIENASVWGILKDKMVDGPIDSNFTKDHVFYWEHPIDGQFIWTWSIKEDGRVTVKTPGLNIYFYMEHLSWDKYRFYYWDDKIPEDVILRPLQEFDWLIDNKKN